MENLSGEKRSGRTISLDRVTVLRLWLRPWLREDVLLTIAGMSSRPTFLSRSSAHEGATIEFASDVTVSANATKTFLQMAAARTAEDSSPPLAGLSSTHQTALRPIRTGIL